MTDDIEARLEAICADLFEPDHELRALQAEILATYPRGRGGIPMIDLSDADAIARRRALHARADENRFAWGRLRAERARLQSELRRLQRAEDAPKRGRAG